MSATQQQILQDAPLLKPIAPAGEEDRATAVLEMVEQHLGFVPDGMKLYSLSPTLMENFFRNVGYFREGTNLSPVLTTMIRYLGSSRAKCQFCVDLNEGFLDQMGVDIAVVRAARDNVLHAPVAESERVLLDIALRSVSDPESIDRTDMDAARAEGWSDHDIFDAVVQATNNRAFNYLLRTFNIEHQGVFS